MKDVKPVILHIIPWQLTVGGAQRFLAYLANHFSEFCDVHVMCPENKQEEIWEKSLGENVIVHGLKSFLKAEELIKEINPDIVHHHSPHSKLLMKYLSGRYNIVGTSHRWDHHKNAAPFVIPICANGFSSKRVIRHGIDLDLFYSKKKKKSSIFTIGFVGRRSAEKLPPSFLDALDKWQPPAGLVFKFVGHGLLNEDTTRITNQLNEKGFVEVISDISPEDMADQYRSMDLLIVPSENDSVSFVAIEAMACGVPVIARAIEGLPDTIGDAGMLLDIDVKSNKDHFFFEAIEYLMDNKKEFSKLRNKAIKRAKKYFSLKKMLKNYEEIYDKRSGGIVKKLNEKIDVSVVMPVWNTKPEWLRYSVESVLTQEDVNFEIVIVDDGSDCKDTLEELKKIHSENPAVIRVIYKDHGGVGSALNEGIKKANSKIIARHDSDDIMCPDRLKNQLPMMKDYSVVSGQVEIMKPLDSGEYETSFTKLKLDSKKAIWNQDWCISHPTVMMHRCQVLKVGSYSSKGPAQDLDLWCRMQRAGFTFFVSDQVFQKYRCHSGQATVGDYHLERAKEIKDWNEWISKNRNSSPMGNVNWSKHLLKNLPVTSAKPKRADKVIHKHPVVRWKTKGTK